MAITNTLNEGVELMDRAYGKSLQPILQATISAPEMTDEDIADAEAIIARRMGRPAIEDTPVEAAALPPAEETDTTTQPHPAVLARGRSLGR